METEHLFKCLLEQPNGLARRILAKAGSNPTGLLDKTEDFIRRQPRVTGDSQQVRSRAQGLYMLLQLVATGTPVKPQKIGQSLMLLHSRNSPLKRVVVQ